MSLRTSVLKRAESFFIPDALQPELEEAIKIYKHPRKSFEEMVPEKYQEFVKDCENVYETKENIENLIIDKVIEPVWHKFDPTEKGYISRE